jgi:hypothetical protein
VSQELEVSSLSLYIGIPTQGFRNIQADIASLIGPVLTIAHQCSCSPGAVPSYVPLVHGASSYVSVFGHWMGGGKSARRVDDHTEVVEFLFRPWELGAVTALVLAEVAFPTLFCARQDEVLTVVRHDGRQYGLSLLRASGIGDPRMRRPDKLGPCEFVEWLLELCRQSCGKKETPHLVLGSENLLDKMAENFVQWCRGERSGRPSQSLPAPGNAALGRDMPTVQHRLLTVAATWLLFHDLGLEGGGRQTSTRRTNDLSVLLKLIDMELYFTAREWEEWIASRGGGVDQHGEDPLANALLWLAYTGDYLEWYLAAAEPNQASYPTHEWRTYNRFGWVTQKGTGSVRSSGRSREPAHWQYWKSRLGLLARVNDCNFPDQSFLSTWDFLSHLLVTPWRLNDAHREHRWSSATVGKRRVTNLSWWAGTLRLWNRTPAATRMWLSPLILNCVDYCISNDPRLRSTDVLEAFVESARYGNPIADRRGGTKGGIV